MLLYCVVISPCFVVRDKYTFFAWNRITLSLWGDSGTYSGASCYSLPRKDTSPNGRAALALAQTNGCQLLFHILPNLIFFKTHMKDTGPVTWICGWKCWIFPNRQLVPPVAPHPRRSLDYCFFDQKNHSFTVQCQTRRITLWSGQSLWSELMLCLDDNWILDPFFLDRSEYSEENLLLDINRYWWLAGMLENPN